jgi:pimeloyl-ACP methyl ester carboxylesterase
VARLNCPTLLLYGSRDVIAPTAHGLRLLARAPRATLQVAPGATHLSLTMEQPPLDALVAWLVEERGVRSEA